MTPSLRNLVRLLWIFSVGLATGPAVGQPAAPKTPPLLLRVGQLYDSETRTFRRNQEILIVGDEIRAVGPKVRRPAGVRVVELGNCTATPGLIDAHTHLLFHQKQTPDGMEVASKVPAPERLRQGLAFAREHLDVGITTVRDVGNSGQFLDVELKKRLGAGEGPGPRMFVSGPILSPPGGQFGRLLPADTFVIRQEYRVVKGADDARAAVLEHVRRGVDVIKVCMNTDNRVLAPDEIAAIVQTAHERRIPVTAHATYDESARDAVLAGVDGIEHGYVLTDSTLMLMAQRRTYLVPTDVSREKGAILVAGIGMKGKEADDYLESALKSFHDRLNRAIRLGVPIVAGADFYNDVPGIRRGEGAIDVLVAYHEAGVPAADVLGFATKNAAKALGVSDRLGAIKPGMKADVAIFEGDFSNDFKKTLSRVRVVVRGGAVYEPTVKK